MTVPLPVILALGQADAEHQLAALAPSAGIYALVIEGSPTHLSWCANLPKRLRRLLFQSPEKTPGMTQRIRDRLTRIECWPTASKLETSLLLYSLTKRIFPEDYVQRLRLRMPWFIGLAASDPFPRLVLSNRLPRSQGTFFGPFASRESAQFYEEQVEGLFQIRRCTETLQPSSAHPGCIYGEMSQCLKPCQLAVSREEYATEAARVGEFLADNGRSALSTLSSARERASEVLDFEQAAYIHKRIERLRNAIAARDEVVSEAAHFNGVALTRSAGIGCICLWPMQEGLWRTPITIDLSSEQPQARSLDALLRETLSDALEEPAGEGKPAEHLALFLRWYRSSWRDGEWFPYRTLTDLNYRKLVREISKLLKADAVSC
ncbi:MAG: UvrB/UvrC motif-containing protein [Acidobacteriota bacterium]|nr:UvrB/UvrC motif-containing protein [Acidobacteriota bacterium]